MNVPNEIPAVLLVEYVADITNMSALIAQLTHLLDMVSKTPEAERTISIEAIAAINTVIKDAADRIDLFINPPASQV